MAAPTLEPTLRNHAHGPVSAPGSVARTELSLRGMTCGNCARHVTEAIQEQPSPAAAAPSSIDAPTPRDVQRAALRDLMALATEVRAKQQAKLEIAGAQNKKEGEAFLAANKTKPGVVALPSGLQYKVLKEGTGPKPVPGDVERVRLWVEVTTGKEMDKDGNIHVLDGDGSAREGLREVDEIESRPSSCRGGGCSSRPLLRHSRFRFRH